MSYQSHHLDIINRANDAAEKLKKKYQKLPIEELFAWLAIGLEREALVSQVYKINNVRKQVYKLVLPADFDPEIIVESIVEAWAQEDTHKSYIKDILNGISPRKGEVIERMKTIFHEIIGNLSGTVIKKLQTGNRLEYSLAKAAIVFGQYCDEMPDFINHLRGGSFKDFCLVSMALEQTAVNGYSRMNELVTIISETLDDNFDHTSLDIHLRNICFDERYHYELFKYLSDFPPTWFVYPGDVRPDGPKNGPKLGPVVPPKNTNSKGYRQNISRIKKEVYPGIKPGGYLLDDLLKYIREYLRNPKVKIEFDQKFAKRQQNNKEKPKVTPPDELKIIYNNIKLRNQIDLTDY